jgi:hypothetical protein
MTITSYDSVDGIATITMDDGKVNALSPEMLADVAGSLQPSPAAQREGASGRRLVAESRLQSGIRLGKAEGVGFEPTSRLTTANGFRDRPVQPLRHPSGEVGLEASGAHSKTAHANPPMLRAGQRSPVPPPRSPAAV